MIKWLISKYGRDIAVKLLAVGATGLSVIGMLTLLYIFILFPDILIVFGLSGILLIFVAVFAYYLYKALLDYFNNILAKRKEKDE